MQKISRLFFLSAPFLFGACSEIADQPNLLFICIDDLRTELDAFGYSQALTPNMDALAAEGSLFFNHYTQVPTSGASRGCLLSGRLPRHYMEGDNGSCEFKMKGKPESEIPESFFHHLKRNGYYTVGIGKISHNPDCRVYSKKGPAEGEMEMPHSWDEYHFDNGKWGSGRDACMGYADGTSRYTWKYQVKPYECGNVDDDGYVDGLNAKIAVKKLNELASKKQPFCLAVGFLKPHLPFVSPKKYWDMYDEDTIALPAMPQIPEHVHPASLHNSFELNFYKAGDEKPSLENPVSDAYARKLRHAYLAAVSYTDALVGKVLDELKRLDLDKNTVVVLWGDHGWHLGEMRVWGKHTLMETALNSPLIIRAPGMKAGVKNHRVVSTVDIYPTVLELCGVPVPQQADLDGRSFVPLLNNPEDLNWEDISYGYWRGGISVRTKNYRYTRYLRDQMPNEELFVYDEGRYERKNIASDHPEILEQLRPIWEKGNTGIFSSEE